MYQEFFSLNQQPFSMTPAPDFLFFTEQHKEALAHLTYGLQGNGGFVVLTGEVGTGKTTICQFLLQDMPADTDIASITNPGVSEISLLVEICEQLLINYDRENITLKIMFDALSSWMLENHLRGRRAIVLIDEAQYLTFNALEQLRLLTNIESNNQKPLQIILVGQTELQKKLLTTELRQLSQRITARYHLRALNKQETNFYIQHCLNTAGAKRPIFDANTISPIFKASHGIPRLINQVCDRCLLTAFTQSSITVTAAVAKKVINETELPKEKKSLAIYIPYLVALIALAFATIFINAQTTTIDKYIDGYADETNSEQESKQKEWLRVIHTANEQASKRPTDSALTDSEILMSIAATNYTLQLASLADAKSVQAFFIKYKHLQGKTYLYQNNSAADPRFIILQGNFTSYKSAKTASAELQENLPELIPWIKDYKTIHNDIK